MTAATVLLPLCLAIGLLGLALAILMWTRGRQGRALQLLGIALLPAGLYLVGLLTMIWDALVALGQWGSRLVFNPTVWTGAGLIALALVLWFIGGSLAARRKTRVAVERATGDRAGRGRIGSAAKPDASAATTSPSASQPKTGQRKPTASKPGSTQKGNSDPELDEIEALLKSRGIE